MSMFEVSKTVLAGGRPPLPPSNILNDIITKCWDSIPEKRPSFETIVEEISSLATEHKIHFKIRRTDSTIKALRALSGKRSERSRSPSPFHMQSSNDLSSLLHSSIDSSSTEKSPDGKTQSSSNNSSTSPRVPHAISPSPTSSLKRRRGLSRQKSFPSFTVSGSSPAQQRPLLVDETSQGSPDFTQDSTEQKIVVKEENTQEKPNTSESVVIDTEDDKKEKEEKEAPTSRSRSHSGLWVKGAKNSSGEPFIPGQAMRQKGKKTSASATVVIGSLPRKGNRENEEEFEEEDESEDKEYEEEDTDSLSSGSSGSSAGNSPESQENIDETKTQKTKKKKRKEKAKTMKEGKEQRKYKKSKEGLPSPLVIPEQAIGTPRRSFDDSEETPPPLVPVTPKTKEFDG